MRPHPLTGRNNAKLNSVEVNILMGRRKMKSVLIFVALVVLAGFPGCASIERGGIFYEAGTADAKKSLSSQIETLRSALRVDSRLREEITKDYPLRFWGVKGSEFYGYLITYSPHPTDGPDGADLLIVGCAYDASHAGSVMRLRKLIDTALGDGVLKKLKVDSRFSPFAQNEGAPIQRATDNDGAVPRRV